MSTLEIRTYEDGDARPLGQVLFRSVREVAAGQYSDAEREAWCQEAPDGSEWEARLANAETVVALRDGVHVGLMSADPARNCFDLAFVVPQEMGGGVSVALYSVLIGRLRARGVTWLYSDASHYARPFLEKRGWRVVRDQTVERHGQTLRNFRMEWGEQSDRESAA